MSVKKIFFVVFLAYLSASYVAVGSTSNAELGDGFNYAKPALLNDAEVYAVFSLSAILTISVVSCIANANAVIAIAAIAITSNAITTAYATSYSDAYAITGYAISAYAISAISAIWANAIANANTIALAPAAAPAA